MIPGTSMPDYNPPPYHAPVNDWHGLIGDERTHVMDRATVLEIAHNGTLNGNFISEDFKSDLDFGFVFITD